MCREGVGITLVVNMELLFYVAKVKSCYPINCFISFRKGFTAEGQRERKQCSEILSEGLSQKKPAVWVILSSDILIQLKPKSKSKQN